MTGCMCLQGIIISQFDQYDYKKCPKDYIIIQFELNHFINYGITFFYCVVYLEILMSIFLKAYIK